MLTAVAVGGQHEGLRRDGRICRVAYMSAREPGPTKFEARNARQAAR